MKVVLLSPGAKIPKRADEYAAGYDVFTPKDVTIKPGRNVVKLDIAIELNPKTEGNMRPRSGFSVNGMEGVSIEDPDVLKRFDADVLDGTIDENYRGNVGVIIKSYETTPFIIKQGTKIAQLVVKDYVSDPFEVVTELSQTERGVQGFGHTGTM